MKKFDIPTFYKSPLISEIKEIRKLNDRGKKDFTPTALDFGPIRFFSARHFGFCYGVENAIEIVYKIIKENPDKRIFLLSEMIHNPKVNQDLQEMGVQFIMDTKGNQFVPWEELNKEDIVAIPAFGTTIEIEGKLKNMGIEVQKYDTTCPFVERVWKRSMKLGQENYTIIIHGKRYHEETRATFSHSRANAPALVVQDLEETKTLAKIILGEIPKEEFYTLFADRYSEGFDVNKDLEQVGVVNQTTMLATDTQAISDYLKEVMLQKFGQEQSEHHFADTRDTLCYATSDNQGAVYGMLEQKADFAVVVGGYNSSNTSHLVELCEEKLPTYYISSAEKIISSTEISHFNFHTKEELTTKNFLPKKDKVDILITSGASCPDAMVDEVIQKIASFYEKSKTNEEVLEAIREEQH
ncbi:MAG: 4-hydroxy-3-methylbut-2-enyl diphosphate reductase [Cytophagales bacterium]|nr:4-hydroxy-3-methylbut-2-enyl diphosphate reductase [Cytophagales bacterium]